VWRNTGGEFTNLPVPGLPGNFDNSLAWGDYDNDTRLDFLVAGTIEGGNASQLWRNNALSSNSPPSAPAGLTATVSDSGTSVVLTWDAPAMIIRPPPVSATTCASARRRWFRHRLPPALTNGVLLAPRVGTARDGSAAFDHLRPGQTYYCSVQAVDSGFVGSRFAVEQQFSTGTTPPRINTVRHANGVAEFDFTGTPGASFIALATTNLSVNLSNWTLLGAPTEIAPGQFQFTDPQAPSHPQRFYRVRSP
jgi:hypothetical protein